MGLRRLTFDLEGDPDGRIAEGDVLVSMRGSAVYRVVTSRRVRSRVHPSRWAIGAVRILRSDLEADDHVLELYWHPRGRRHRLGSA